MKAKLQQTKGETLVETLAALAIVVLAVFLLSNMLMAAARLNAKSSSLSDSYQRELAIVEGGQAYVGSEAFVATFKDAEAAEGTVSDFVSRIRESLKSESGTIKIKYKESDGTVEKVISVNVQFVSGEDGDLSYYTLPASAASGNGGG